MKIAFLAPAGAMHRFNGSFGKSLHYAPLTLTTLAALIPESLNAEAKIYDETIENFEQDYYAYVYKDVMPMQIILDKEVSLLF